MLLYRAIDIEVKLDNIKEVSSQYINTHNLTILYYGINNFLHRCDGCTGRPANLHYLIYFSGKK